MLFCIQDENIYLSLLSFQLKIDASYKMHPDETDSFDFPFGISVTFYFYFEKNSHSLFT